MAIIALQQFAAPGATPVGNNTTSEGLWFNNYYKLGDPNINNTGANTVAILGLIYKLAAAGGTNYKLNHAGLIQDTWVYLNSMVLRMMDFNTARAVNDWNSGNVADGTLSTDPQALFKEGRDFFALPEDTQERILAFLRAQLRS